MERSYKRKKEGGKSGVVERERCGEGNKMKGNGVKKIETSWEVSFPKDRGVTLDVLPLGKKKPIANSFSVVEFLSSCLLLG